MIAALPASVVRTCAASAGGRLTSSVGTTDSPTEVRDPTRARGSTGAVESAATGVVAAQGRADGCGDGQLEDGVFAVPGRGKAVDVGVGDTGSTAVATSASRPSTT